MAQLAVRAGTPPSAVELLERYHAIVWTDRLPDLWASWEAWFAELAETHTTFAVLPFFRSPNPDRSWVTAAGAVLDGAALAQSTLAIPWSPEAGLCIRSGYLALRQLADLYGLPYDSDPAPDGPISISREEFDEAYQRLGGAGVPDASRPGARMARLRRMAGQLRRRARRHGRPHGGAVRAVVLGPVVALPAPAAHERSNNQDSCPATGASRRMNHSDPKAASKISGAAARKNESAGI